MPKERGQSVAPRRLPASFVPLSNAISLPRSLGGMLFSSIARAIAVFSSGASSMMPTSFAGAALMW